MDSVERLTDEVLPLPHDMVDEMFRRIDKDEVIDLKVVYQALVGPQTALRARAARYLGSHGNDTSVPQLIDALRDQTGHVGVHYQNAGMATTRYWVNESLKTITRQDFGFVWDGPIDEREQAVLRWHAWYKDTHRAR